MNTGRACAIFYNITSPDYSMEEKGEAIYRVVNMDTHNGIKKSAMLDVIRFLLDLCYDIEKPEEK